MTTDPQRPDVNGLIDGINAAADSAIRDFQRASDDYYNAILSGKDDEIARLTALLEEASNGGGEPATSDAKLGTTFGEAVGPSDAGAARIYDPGDDQALKPAVARGVTRIGLSRKDDSKNPDVVIAGIKSVFARYPQITEIDNMHENEVDRTDHRGGSDADMLAWAKEHKAIQDKIRATDFGAGKSVKTSVDMTRWGTVQGRSQKMMQKLKDIGALPDVYGSSCYGPGRDKKPAVKDRPEDHLGMCIDVAIQFGIRLFSCYEIACPLSPNYDRPSYVATWFPWADAYCKSKGNASDGKPVIQIRDWDYWNGQKAGGVDNRFSADGSTATTVGKTEKAFFASAG